MAPTSRLRHGTRSCTTTRRRDPAPRCRTHGSTGPAAAVSPRSTWSAADASPSSPALAATSPSVRAVTTRTCTAIGPPCPASPMQARYWSVRTVTWAPAGPPRRSTLTRPTPSTPPCARFWTGRDRPVVQRGALRRGGCRQLRFHSRSPPANPPSVAGPPPPCIHQGGGAHRGGMGGRHQLLDRDRADLGRSAPGVHPPL